MLRRAPTAAAARWPRVPMQPTNGADAIWRAAAFSLARVRTTRYIFCIEWNTPTSFMLTSSEFGG